MSDLINRQRVVERMLAAARPLAEIEDYIEDCGLDETLVDSVRKTAA